MSLSLSHTNIQKTHTSTSQLHTDETPTARHSVMTHAIIAFPPAVSITLGIVELITVVHYQTATAERKDSGLKRLVMTNTTVEMDSSLTLR